MTVPDAVGLIGVALYVEAYAGLQARTLGLADATYTVLNATGGLAVIFSLFIRQACVGRYRRSVVRVGRECDVLLRVQCRQSGNQRRANPVEGTAAECQPSRCRAAVG